MKFIEKLISIINAILFIWSWKVTVEKERHEDARKLSEEADVAIKERRYDDVIIIWNRMRLL